MHIIVDELREFQRLTCDAELDRKYGYYNALLIS